MSEAIARSIVLGKKPDGIPDTLKIKMPDGTEGLLPVTFKYRTRTEFGEFLDSIFGAEPPPFDGTAKTAAKQQQRANVQLNGQYIHGCLKDWGLDAPFTLQACIQLADELPGAVQEIMDTYRRLTVEGRLGN
ncbi:phage tail assembly chaperone [Comamonas antarctica]|uniref:phage tail assembly chaperone n=1 Tax=Comamonas antarctica TaxID=2743470 RepID=UPI0028E9AFE5|nr:phage tail assembly chaperone [Comamonas antarctica]